MNDTRLKSFNLKDIRIDDPFWNRYIALVKDTILPYQWDAMNDRIEGAAKSHCIENSASQQEKQKVNLGAWFSKTLTLLNG